MVFKTLRAGPKMIKLTILPSNFCFNDTQTCFTSLLGINKHLMSAFIMHYYACIYFDSHVTN